MYIGLCSIIEICSTNTFCTAQQTTVSVTYCK